MLDHASKVRWREISVATLISTAGMGQQQIRQ